MAVENGGRSFSEIKDDICKYISSMETPTDLLMIMTYGISLPPAVRLLLEAGILERIADSPQPLTASELTSGLPKLPQTQEIEQIEFINRMLSAVVVLQLIDEVGPAIYQRNIMTMALSKTGFNAGYAMMFDSLLGPSSTVSHVVDWAKNNGYTASPTGTDGPFQQARGIAGTTTFDHWSIVEPLTLSRLSHWMKQLQADRLNWSAWFPAENIFTADSDDEDRVFMVDVGGGLGHDLSGFAKRYPEKKMKLILQDMPQVLEEAKEGSLDPRIQPMGHDFFEAQPIKGANIYFMHKITHDWPDADCIRIITQLRDAMAPDSRIFINDMIIPNQGIPPFGPASDLSMLAMLSAKERNESMWQRLVAGVGGLAIRKLWQAPEMKGEGIVEIVRAA